MLRIIVAHSSNRVIGRDGGLPWRLPTDLKRFKELTTGHAVIMGRRTYESLPPHFRPLPDRRNLVLTTRAGYDAPETFGSLQSALDACNADAWVIGGADVYGQALPFAQRAYVTYVDEHVHGDAFFPALDGAWELIEESDEARENGYPFVFRTYERAH